MFGVLGNSEHLEFKKEITRTRKKAQRIKQEIAREDFMDYIQVFRIYSHSYGESLKFYVHLKRNALTSKWGKN